MARPACRSRRRRGGSLSPSSRLREIADGQVAAVGTEGQGGCVSFRFVPGPAGPGRFLINLPLCASQMLTDSSCGEDACHEARDRWPGTGRRGCRQQPERCREWIANFLTILFSAMLEIAASRRVLSPGGDVLPVGRDGRGMGVDVLADDGHDGLEGFDFMPGREGPVAPGDRAPSGPRPSRGAGFAPRVCGGGDNQRESRSNDVAQARGFVPVSRIALDG